MALIQKSWDDETLFQEARRILIACVQHITYAEYLPIILGLDYVNRKGLKPLNFGYSVYKNNVDPRIINAFAAAGFRVLHSTIQGKLE